MMPPNPDYPQLWERGTLEIAEKPIGPVILRSQQATKNLHLLETT